MLTRPVLELVPSSGHDRQLFIQEPISSRILIEREIRNLGRKTDNTLITDLGTRFNLTQEKLNTNVSLLAPALIIEICRYQFT